MQSSVAKLSLVLGGARSGKSRYAEGLIASLPAPWQPPWNYVATAEPGDAEMAERIAAHRARRGAAWQTIEAPRDLASPLQSCQAKPVLIDCLTLWLSNLMLDAADIEMEIERFEKALAAAQAPIVMVANEVGYGLVPEYQLGRRFRDLQGVLNQRLAARAVRVVLVVAGLPLALKGASYGFARQAISGAIMTQSTEEAERHRAKMAKRKAVQDAEVAGKTIEKGLLIVHTGTGKGKSTAAFGLALRMLGRGQRVGVVQFIKGAWHSAERDAFARFGDQLVWHTMGEGFTWETQDRARDVAAAERAWSKARELMGDPNLAMLVLDELNIALRYDYLDLAQVVAALKARPYGLHVIVTGRNAKPELVAAADLVTEMTLVKHHFAAGVKAQPGIEF